MTDSTKRYKKKKDKLGKKSKADPKDICNYCKKTWGIGSKTVQRKQRKILLLLLLKMTSHQKAI